MSKIKAFFKRNFKILAICCIAIVFLLYLACYIFTLGENREGDLLAEINLSWTDEGICATNFAGGTGTVDDPYIIADASQLAYLAKYANEGNCKEYAYYKIIRPILLSDHYWEPIGKILDNGENNSFSGSIDCNNNPIIGMTISGEYEYAGLFGAVDNLEIKNAILLNSDINLTGDVGAAGLVAGYINNTVGEIKISSSFVSGTITHNGRFVSTKDGIGGLIGTMVECKKATFENTYIKASIKVPNRTANVCLGALVGFSNSQIDFNNTISDSKVFSDDLKQLYVGNFGRDNESLWAIVEPINSTRPILKSQYWIGDQYINTGEEITSFLTSNSYKDASGNLEFLKPTTIKYTISSTWSVSNNSTRKGFNAGVTTRTGMSQAVEGEKIEPVLMSPEGYGASTLLFNDEEVHGYFVMPAMDSSFEVIFQPLDYTITFDSDGTGVIDNRIATYDAVLEKLPVPSRDGYIFMGWSTDPAHSNMISDAEGNVYKLLSGYTDENGNWIKASDATFYAYWKKNAAYLITDWQDKIAAELNGTRESVLPKIKSISFSRVKIPTNNEVSVGAIDQGTLTGNSLTPYDPQSDDCFDITAYISGNASEGFNITFYSQAQIYAPVNSSFLFSNSQLENDRDAFSFNNLTSFDFSNFDTSKVKTMRGMFAGLRSLISLNLANFNTIDVEDMAYMFYFNDLIKTLDLSNFDTSKVTDMAYMFAVSSVEEINLSNFNTSYVTDMSYMFNECVEIKTLNLSSFNTINVTNFSMMFGSLKVEQLNLSMFDMTNANQAADMLSSINGLIILQTPKNVNVDIDLPNSLTMYDNKLVAYTKISSGTTSSIELRIGYTVSFIPNGGTVTPKSKIVRYGKTYGESTGIPTATRDGYSFDGWYTSETNGTRVYSYTSLTKNQNHNIYAYWTKTYNLTFDANGGTIAGSETKVYTRKVNTTYNSSIPTRSGYKFVGWAPKNKTFNDIESTYNTVSTNLLSSKTTTTFNGSYAEALDTKYKYTDKISVSVFAYMDDWTQYSSKDMRLLSSTQSGGWNFEATDSSNTAKIKLSIRDNKGGLIGAGYKYAESQLTVTDLGKKSWHLFQFVFDGTTAYYSIDGKFQSSVTFDGTSIAYHDSNAIFIGAEAGSNATSPAGNYFTGKMKYVNIVNTANLTNFKHTFVEDMTYVAQWVKV